MDAARLIPRHIEDDGCVVRPLGALQSVSSHQQIDTCWSGLSGIASPEKAGCAEMRSLAFTGFVAAPISNAGADDGVGLSFGCLHGNAVVMMRAWTRLHRRHSGADVTQTDLLALSDFELPGWRNSTARDLGVAEMGIVCVRVTAKLEGAEPIEDLASNLDYWFDLLGVRTPDLARLRAFADALDAPVLNLRTNDNHTCEILGDRAYVLPQRGTWHGLQVPMVGPAGSIARSWIEAAAVPPIEVIEVEPKRFQFSPGDLLQRFAATDHIRVLEDAELIVTDCWPAEAADDARQQLAAQQITAGVLDGCRPDVVFVPCPPVTRGQEVSADAMQHPRCLATPAKAFLMHIQNAFVESSV